MAKDNRAYRDEMLRDFAQRAKNPDLSSLDVFRPIVWIKGIRYFLGETVKLVSDENPQAVDDLIAKLNKRDEKYFDPKNLKSEAYDIAKHYAQNEVSSRPVLSKFLNNVFESLSDSGEIDQLEKIHPGAKKLFEEAWTVADADKEIKDRITKLEENFNILEEILGKKVEIVEENANKTFDLAGPGLLDGDDITEMRDLVSPYGCACDPETLRALPPSQQINIKMITGNLKEKREAYQKACQKEQAE
ncbi:MAG: hypothetical protein KDH94_06980, partial [Coxiellaceae bacterium]|nr:hypothetical protein [Coxiellaceae bacterium]